MRAASAELDLAFNRAGYNVDDPVEVAGPADKPKYKTTINKNKREKMTLSNSRWLTNRI